MAEPEQRPEGDAAGSGDNSSGHPFPVIGIGASAGGLQAAEEFFDAVPPEPGMAFVLIMHLEPKHKSILSEILGRHTPMTVREMTGSTGIEKNTVYVISPDHNLRIRGDTIEAGPRTDEVPPTPIDIFLGTLATEWGEHAAAVILSGAGSDGTIGAAKIREHGGVVVVQDPAQAEHHSMPQSVVEAFVADRVMPVREMPDFLLSYFAGHRGRELLDEEEALKTQEALRRIMFLLRKRTGNDFSHYKESTLVRRVQRRMGVTNIDDIQEYSHLLQKNADEAVALFKELLIGVTGFFRDSDCFEKLRTAIIPEILKGNDGRHTIRVWVPGVATGEEAYSIAMLLAESRDEYQVDAQIQIFATDLNNDAIEFARAGRYPAGIAPDVGTERLKRYFTREGDYYRVKRDIRELIVFAVHNLIKDPPFTKMDLISCRNLLIYLKNDMQKKVLPLFHYSLRRNGYLHLGTSETIGTFSHLFATVDSKCRVFRRRDTGVNQAIPVDLPLAGTFDHRKQKTRRTQDSNPVTTQGALLNHMIRKYVPPFVVIDYLGNIVEIHGRTGQFLEPAEGYAAMSIYDMARKGLGSHLLAAVRQAKMTHSEVQRSHVPVQTNGDEIDITITVSPLGDAEHDHPRFVILFQETTPEAAPRRKTGENEKQAQEDQDNLEKELSRTKDRLQMTIEELESSNEELRSTNEEYQSTNEELKSANEELETSHEELQSLNEELTTVNRELQEKIEALTGAHQEIQLFLNSLGVPTIFLDDDLRIKRFTVQATDIVRLIESDIGRPLSDLTSRLADNTLIDDARRVRDTMVYQEKEVQTEDGHWYLRRIIPYRSTDGKVVGVVINFIDIDEMKRTEKAFEQSRRRLEHAGAMVESFPRPLLLLDKEHIVLAANRAFSDLFGVKPDHLPGKSVHEIANGRLDIANFRESIDSVFQREDRFQHQQIETEIEGIGKRWIIIYAAPVILDTTMQDRVLVEMVTPTQNSA